MDQDEREVNDVVRVMGSGGGNVFSAIHSILAEIDPCKVITMVRVAVRALGDGHAWF